MAKISLLEKIRSVALSAAIAAGRGKMLLVSTVKSAAYRRGRAYTDGLAVLVRRTDDGRQIELRGVKAEPVRTDGRTYDAGLWGPTYTLDSRAAVELAEALQAATEAAGDDQVFFDAMARQEGPDRDTPPADDNHDASVAAIKAAAAALGVTVPDYLELLRRHGAAAPAPAPAIAPAASTVECGRCAGKHTGRHAKGCPNATKARARA